METCSPARGIAPCQPIGIQLAEAVIEASSPGYARGTRQPFGGDGPYLCERPRTRQKKGRGDLGPFLNSAAHSFAFAKYDWFLDAEQLLQN